MRQAFPGGCLRIARQNEPLGSRLIHTRPGVSPDDFPQIIRYQPTAPGKPMTNPVLGGPHTMSSVDMKSQMPISLPALVANQFLAPQLDRSNLPKPSNDPICRG